MSIKHVGWTLVALAAAGLAGGVVMAQNSPDGATASSTPAPHARGHGRAGRAVMGIGMMRALHQLNLSSDQQQQIHTLLSNARAQNNDIERPDFIALNDPGDQNHAAAVQQVENNFKARLEQRDALEQQIFEVLTPAQQTQLASVLQNMKARMAQHASAPAGG
jgi:Spy/CpxP family protein refolding chaperone